MTDLSDLIRRLREDRLMNPDYKTRLEAADALESLNTEAKEYGSKAIELTSELLDAKAEIERLEAVIDEQAKMLKDRDELQAEILEQKAEIERLREDIDGWKVANMGLKRMLCKADPERYPPEDNL